MRDEFWELACDVEQLWRFLLAVVIVLFAMLGMSFPFIDRGSGSYYIGLLSLSLLVPLLVSSAFVVRRCAMKNREQPKDTDQTSGSSE